MRVRRPGAAAPLPNPAAPCFQRAVRVTGDGLFPGRVEETPERLCAAASVAVHRGGAGVRRPAAGTGKGGLGAQDLRPCGSDSVVPQVHAASGTPNGPAVTKGGGGGAGGGVPPPARLPGAQRPWTGTRSTQQLGPVRGRASVGPGQDHQVREAAVALVPDLRPRRARRRRAAPSCRASPGRPGLSPEGARSPGLGAGSGWSKLRCPTPGASRGKLATQRQRFRLAHVHPDRSGGPPPAASGPRPAVNRTRRAREAVGNSLGSHRARSCSRGGARACIPGREVVEPRPRGPAPRGTRPAASPGHAVPDSGGESRRRGRGSRRAG